MVKTNKKQLTVNVSKENLEKLDSIKNQELYAMGNAVTKSLAVDMALGLFFKQLSTGQSVDDIIGAIYGGE